MDDLRVTKQFGGALPFLLGFLVMAVAGWILFPDVLFCPKEQPFRFSHKVHVEGQDMACDDCHYFREDGSYQGFPSNEECSACHDPGDPEEVLAAISDVVGGMDKIEEILKQPEGPAELDDLIQSTEPDDIQAEREMLVKYLIPGIEVPWYNYQFQPDNVFFSHKAHANLTAADLGGHGDEGEHGEASAEEAEEAGEAANCNLCHPKDIHLGDTPPLFEENILTGYSKMTMKMWECERCHAQMHQSNACYVCHK